MFDLKVNIDPTIFTWEQVKKIEAMKKAKYVCETCVKNKDGGWVNRPVAIFYQENPPEGFNNHFGLYWNNSDFDDSEAALMICGVESAVSQRIDGIAANDGEVIFSRWRHDYRISKDESVWIDGGRDYTRYPGGELVTLNIVKDKLEIQRL